MYELAVVLHDESGNNNGTGIQLIKEATHAERIRYDASVTPHVLYVPGISCPVISDLQTDISDLQTASTGHGTDISTLQNTITTLQNTINTQALTISALNGALTSLTNRVETLEDPMAAVHVDNN